MGGLSELGAYTGRQSFRGACERYRRLQIRPIHRADGCAAEPCVASRNPAAATSDAGSDAKPASCEPVRSTHLDDPLDATVEQLQFSPELLTWPTKSTPR